MALLERMETIAAHRLLDEAGIPTGNLVERIRALVERDRQRVELLQREIQPLRSRMDRRGAA